MEKLFFKNQNRLQFSIAALGVFLGLTLMLIAVQTFDKAQKYGEASELLDDNTLVVQKKIGRGAHLGIGNPNFTDTQIEKIKQKDFVASCSAIISNKFEVLVQIDDPIIPSFNSNIYLQSVEGEFLDIPSHKFTWDTTREAVPIVMPRNFLIMLNTFLSASQLPRLSEDLITNVKMNLLIGERGQRIVFPATIIGFTNSFSSILAPSSFLNWANLSYSNGKDDMRSQLVVKAKTGAFGLLESYLEDNGLESSSDQLFIERLKSGLSAGIIGVITLSILTLLLSLMLMIQYLQLILSNCIYEIKIMLRLGHTVKTMRNVFLRYFSIVFFVLSILSFTAFYLLTQVIESKLIASGIILDTGVSTYSILSLCIVFITFVITIMQTASATIRTHF